MNLVKEFQVVRVSINIYVGIKRCDVLASFFIIVLVALK